MLPNKSNPSTLSFGSSSSSLAGWKTGNSRHILHSGSSVIFGHVLSLGEPSSLNIFSSWSAGELPGNSGCPLAISAMMHPVDQMSMDVEYCREPIRTSGALYHNVTTSWEYPLTGMPNALARPKSASFNSMRLLISRFCGFKSLCNTLCS